MKKVVIHTIYLLVLHGVILAQEPYVLVVSLDGFRWDYCTKAATPVFDSIAKYGVKAESMEPAFPTKTFPNHYTLVTGLYPDNHGIVNNSFYSPEHQNVYSIGDRKKVKDGTYYSGEPLWNLAEKQNITSATFFWVGSEADVNKRQASYWKKYEHNFPFKQRIDTVISWLKLPENKRPKLLFLYFHEPDSKGHKFGPDSKEIQDLVPQLNHLLGSLFKALNDLPISEKINIIITSDHGMSTVSKNRTVFLNHYLKESWTERIVGSNPVYNIWAKDDYLDSIRIALNKVPHVSYFENATGHDYFNYGENSRTGTFTIVADSSWSIQTKSNQYSDNRGAHGFDNRNKDMHTIFYAIGPAFKRNYNAGIIKNVDIYPLIANILRLEIPEIDGKFDRIKHVLKD